MRQMILCRESLSRKLRNDPTNPAIHDKIRNLRRIIKSRLRADFKDRAINTLSPNCLKDSWKFIRKATFSASKGSQLVPNIHELNDHFSEVVTSNVPLLPYDNSRSIQASDNNSFNISPVNVLSVSKLLLNVKQDTTTGPDDLPAFLIRKLAYSLAPSVTQLFNLSINTGTFPKVWKSANVCPVYKRKGPKTDVDNYRPISILPILGRLLEKIICRQLQTFCDTNAVIPIQQFGFRRNSSCELALLAAQDKWLDDISKGSFVGTLLIDLSKAFDSIEHYQLLEELSKIGCSTNSLRWFTNYLVNRSQRVRANNVTTPWRSVTRGVPQGSSLSPLLFNILVRRLPECSGSDCFQFADDLTNSVAESNPGLLSSKLEAVYYNVKTFCQEFHLQINLKKTQLIVFKSSTRLLPKDFQIVLDDVTFQPLNEVKLLGVQLDRHLTMANHIDATVSKCHGLLGMLRRASKVLPRDLLKLTYCSLIRSQLEYSSAVFAMAAPTHLSKLDTIQKIASRIITSSDSRAHSAPLLELLDLDQLQTRRLAHVASVVSSVLEGRSHPYFTGFFNSTDNSKDAVTRQLPSRVLAKRFSSFGKTMYDKFHTPNLSLTPYLQSMSTGRPLSHSLLVHSAQAQTTVNNHQVIPDPAPVTSLLNSSQLDASDNATVLDDGR